MPHEVIFSPDTFYVYNNTAANVIISCNVSGTPIPTVIWFKEETLLDKNLVHGNTLVINVTENLEPYQLGVCYYCLATNRIGLNHSITATVRSENIFVRQICK